MVIFPRVEDFANTGSCCSRYQQQPQFAQPTTDRRARSPDNYGGDHDGQEQKRPKKSGHRRFRVPRLAVTPDFAQQQSQIVRRTFERMHFAHVGLTAHPRSPATPGLAHMGKGSFAPFAAPPIQLPSLLPAHTRRRLARKASSCSTGLSVQHRLFCRRSGIYVRTPCSANSANKPLS